MPRPVPTGLRTGVGMGKLRAPCAHSLVPRRARRTRAARPCSPSTRWPCACAHLLQDLSVHAHRNVLPGRAQQTSWCGSKCTRRARHTRAARPCSPSARWPHACAHLLQDLSVRAHRNVWLERTRCRRAGAPRVRASAPRVCAAGCCDGGDCGGGGGGVIVGVAVLPIAPVPATLPFHDSGAWSCRMSGEEMGEAREASSIEQEAFFCEAQVSLVQRE